MPSTSSNPSSLSLATTTEPSSSPSISLVPTSSLSSIVSFSSPRVKSSTQEPTTSVRSTSNRSAIPAPLDSTSPTSSVSRSFELVRTSKLTRTSIVFNYSRPYHASWRRTDFGRQERRSGCDSQRPRRFDRRDSRRRRNRSSSLELFLQRRSSPHFHRPRPSFFLPSQEVQGQGRSNPRNLVVPFPFANSHRRSSSQASSSDRLFRVELSRQNCEGRDRWTSIERTWTWRRRRKHCRLGSERERRSWRSRSLDGLQEGELLDSVRHPVRQSIQEPLQESDVDGGSLHHEYRRCS